MRVYKKSIKLKRTGQTMRIKRLDFQEVVVKVVPVLSDVTTSHAAKRINNKRKKSSAVAVPVLRRSDLVGSSQRAGDIVETTPRVDNIVGKTPRVVKVRVYKNK